ncbi:MAG TPA: hypothetical protein VLN59_06200 [Burkholderiales bacterium]|nr:hypothetical protein [Burkholderiales bacterium]
MEQKAINAVAGILSEWNPLGPGAHTYADLNGYRNEAIEILFELQIRSSRRHAERIVMEVLNQAFHLSLSAQDCTAVTTRILAILESRQ